MSFSKDMRGRLAFEVLVQLGALVRLCGAARAARRPAAAGRGGRSNGGNDDEELGPPPRPSAERVLSCRRHTNYTMASFGIGISMLELLVLAVQLQPAASLQLPGRTTSRRRIVLTNTSFVKEKSQGPRTSCAVKGPRSSMAHIILDTIETVVSTAVIPVVAASEGCSTTLLLGHAKHWECGQLFVMPCLVGAPQSIQFGASGEPQPKVVRVAPCKDFAIRVRLHARGFLFQRQVGLRCFGGILGGHGGAGGRAIRDEDPPRRVWRLAMPCAGLEGGVAGQASELLEHRPPAEQRDDAGPDDQARGLRLLWAQRGRRALHPSHMVALRGDSRRLRNANAVV